MRIVTTEDIATHIPDRVVQFTDDVLEKIALASVSNSKLAIWQAGFKKGYAVGQLDTKKECEG